MSKKECFPTKRSKATRGVDHKHSSSPPTARNFNPRGVARRKKVVNNERGANFKGGGKKSPKKLKPLMEMSEEEIEEAFWILEDEWRQRLKVGY